MNIARKICTVRYQSINKRFSRKFAISSNRYESSTQPQVKDEKYDFEDLKLIERVERRKAQIPPFMKNVFVSIFNRDLLAYPEILNKDESEALDQRIAALDRVFSDPDKTLEDRKNALKGTKMYAAPVALTKNGLATNYTESLRYLETISTDLQLSQQLSDHWVGLNALKIGLAEDMYEKVIDDLTTGDNMIALCIRERVAERISQADFRTYAELDENGVWRISGEKICLQSSEYYLVLSIVDTNRLKMFLVHPGAYGVNHNGTYITFMKTPAIPLDMTTEENLAKTLGVSRLYTAALSRSSLWQAVKTINEYISPKIFSGKPMSEVSTIRLVIGEALLKIYASESAEYFTAGLLDGYVDPDAELEMAMCRNFIAEQGLNALLKLIAIPNIEMKEETLQLLQNMRTLTLTGETIDNVNMFIALNGIHHAGKMMSEEIKQIRNPLFNPTFILKKILADRHQEKDDPKLNLYLAEHLHPSLRKPSEQLEYCVLRMKFACETIMSRHGVDVASAFTELNRMAEAGSEILAMTAVLARASRAYCIGLRNAEVEMKLAACFVEDSKERVKKLIRDVNDGEYLNLDKFKTSFGKKVLETKSVLVEKPTARVFW
ncbi:PREDICTED: acyl-CoA dehydrogenase family member 9, mitochondrial [Papilio xuthus]|uniref:Acyl-CoA dehydrogenase family member 9, mitochondrial n=1 Tax=Papilio xuthus TaxID=66420 RepID=A0AAJ6Z5Q3_PAPXU|nr:PREDICTED: acyl-CoA dehydrogenase family member 9, mitochondrial [Papilio xuthus]